MKATSDIFTLGWPALIASGILFLVIIGIFVKVFSGKPEGNADSLDKPRFQGYIEGNDGNPVEDWRPDSELLDEIDRGRGVNLAKKE